MREVHILPFIKSYLKQLNESLEKLDPAYKLSKTQQLWISFCLAGILLTNSVCWARYSRLSMGYWTVGILSWFFRTSKINWTKLLEHSTRFILTKYNITEGVLVLDDTERERSKNAKQLYKLGKQKDKKSGGYFTGQSIVFLLLVSSKCSIPVGFAFYQMDPVLGAWKKEDDRLKKKKVAKRHRPEEPTRSSAYPTKLQLGVNLVAAFQNTFSFIKIRAVIADALYGTAEFISGVAASYPKAQILTQIRNNQKIIIGTKTYSVSEYFAGRAAIQSSFIVRGGNRVKIYYSSTIAKVHAQGTKRLIIALKYEGETHFRYIIAKDMTWRVQEVLCCFSYRWLVEVFNQDWKMYEGWGQLAKQTGEEGSRRSLTLSLLFDHCLLSHPTQAAMIKNNLPLYTVGSLRDQLSKQSLLQFVSHILEQPNPKDYLEQLTEQIEQVCQLRQSSKHMSGRTMYWSSD